MTLETFLSQVRVYLNDTERLEYSDFELINYINDGIEFIEDIITQLQSSINLIALEITSNETSLPYDLLKIDKVEDIKRQMLLYVERTKNVNKGEYSVVGNNIYLNESDLGSILYYHSEFEKITGVKEGDKFIEDISITYVPLITVLKDYVIIKSLTRLEYGTQQEEQRLQQISQTIQDIVKRRDGLVTLIPRGSLTDWCRGR